MIVVVLGLVLFGKSCLAIPISNDTIPSKSHLVLPEINIKGNAMVAKRRGDTLVFAADRYKQANAIRLEQLLSNVPGFQVDANGRISFNGKPIQKLMLDGDDLTAENYQLISRNLRSLLIDSIQVLEKYNENRLLKGINEDKGIAINLVLKPSYYGRPTVNVISAYAPKKNGELQGELVHLHKQLKQFVLFNSNNIGAFPLQNQFIEQALDVAKQDVLYHSWPHVLQNSYSGGLSNKHINQNSDWGFAYASTVKVNDNNRIRFNLRKSYQQMFNRLNQDQFFSNGDDFSIQLYAVTALMRQSHETNGAVDWESDKRDKSTAKYQLRFYDDRRKDVVREERELTALNKVRATSILYSKGISFSMIQTWAVKSNQVWLWEADVEGSNNKYTILINRYDFMNHDSSRKVLTQLVNHSGKNMRTGIGYFKKTRSININIWLRSSFSSLHSKQGLSQLHSTIFKNHLSAHITKPLGKKVNLEMQSMIGGLNYLMNATRNFQMMYHLAQAVVWKKKATQQFSLNYGILRQGTELRKLFAGEVYLNGTSLIKAPSDLAFPLSIYGQFSFSTINLYSGLTFGGQLQIKQVKGDYFMSVELDPFFTKMTELLNGVQSTRSLNLHVEKIIHPLRVKYRLQANVLQIKRLSQFNKQRFYAFNEVYRFGNSLTSNWRKGYNMQMEYHYIRSKFNRINERSSLWNNRHEFKTTLQFQFSRQVNANLMLVHYFGKDLQPLDLFDCSINWMINNKYRIYMQGFNLLNRKIFIEQLVQANSISTNRQELIGRRIILGIDFPL